jgi:DNA-binding FadR family transcriptional regulator
VARDVTLRRAAEEDQAFLAAIVSASHNAIIGLSLAGLWPLTGGAACCSPCQPCQT